MQINQEALRRASLKFDQPNQTAPCYKKALNTLYNLVQSLASRLCGSRQMKDRKIEVVTTAFTPLSQNPENNPLAITKRTTKSSLPEGRAGSCF